MALRLFLVGVVASLALDLPHGGVRPNLRSPLDVESRTSAPENLASTDAPQVKPGLRPRLAMLRDRVNARIAEMSAPAKPILPGRAEAEAVLAAEKAAQIVAPIVEAVPAVDPIMPAPPEFVFSLTEATPVVDLASTEPMPAPPMLTDEVVAPQPAPATAPAPVVAELSVKPEDADAEFRHVVANMASAFAADLPVPTTEPKALLAEVVPPVAPAVAAEELTDSLVDLFPGLAFALNREAEGLTPIPMPPVEIVEEARVEPMPEPVATEPAPEPVPPVSVVESTSSNTNETSRAEKLATAVKLTGQAVNAWAGLLSQRPSVSAMQR